MVQCAKAEAAEQSKSRCKPEDSPGATDSHGADDSPKVDVAEEQVEEKADTAVAATKTQVICPMDIYI